MKTNLLKCLVLLSLSAPLAANAAPIIYDVNRIVGSGSVMGTITTDGALGAIGAANITAFDIAITDGIHTAIIASALGHVVEVHNAFGSLQASLTALTFNFGSFAPDQLFFRDLTVTDLYLLDGIGGLETVSSAGNFNIGVFHLTEITVGTARVAALAEPGSLGLMLIGFAGLGFSRNRKQR